VQKRIDDVSALRCVTVDFAILASLASAAGEVTAGLAEINDSLPPGLWLRSPAG